MKDTMIRGLLFDNTVNMIAVSGAELVEAARRAHDLSHVNTAALGRLLMQTAMMTTSLKNDTDSITVVLDGDGSAGKLLTVGKHDNSVKGYVDFPQTELPLKENGKLNVSAAVGSNGELRVIRDLSLREPYIGRCPLTDGEIANDFANYYLKSEQQPSLVYLGVRVNPTTGEVRSAAGMILQPLPNCPDEDIAAMEAAAGSIASLARLIDDGYDIQQASAELLKGMNLSITETLHPRFFCGCGRTRIERVLISLGREELTDMIEKDHSAELTCRFCNKKYCFSEDELKSVLREAQQHCTDAEDGNE